MNAILGFGMLLIGCVAAFDMYDDSHTYGIEPPRDENYNDESYDYQDPGPYRPMIRDDPVQSLMLYQLFNALQNRDAGRLRMHYRPKFSMVDTPLAAYGHVPYSDLMDLKGAVAKRHALVPRSLPIAVKKEKERSANQQESKQGPQKVHMAPYWVCYPYLKFCSYRHPAD